MASVYQEFILCAFLAIKWSNMTDFKWKSGNLVKITMHCNNGQSILRKMFKIVATKCHLLRLECTKFDFGWGSAPDPAGGAYSAPQTR